MGINDSFKQYLVITWKHFLIFFSFFYSDFQILWIFKIHRNFIYLFLKILIIIYTIMKFLFDYLNLQITIVSYSYKN